MSEQTENQRITGEIIDAIVEYDAWRDNLHPNDLPLAKARIMKALEDKDASLAALRKERELLRKALILGEQHATFDCPHESEQQCKCAEAERKLWNAYREATAKALTPRQEERG